MLWIILGVVAALLLLLIVLIAAKPNKFKVERGININASPATIFSYVNDFHNWVLWSPWEKLDPEMKKVFEGPIAGKDSSYHWVGNKQVGEGQMTILESTPSSHIRIKLQFIKPIATTNDTVFSFQPEGNDTAVRWSMEGKSNFMMKIFTLFMNMDEMIGRDFVKGLGALKNLSEGKK